MRKNQNEQEEQKNREKRDGQDTNETKEEGKVKEQEKNGRWSGIKKIIRRIKQIFFLTVTIIAAFAIWKFFFQDGAVEEEKVTIVTSSQLEKVLQISELSTYKVTYNGVAAVSDDKDKLLYYVAYEAAVSIGLDMNQIKVEVDEAAEEDKKIVVTLPEVEIVSVDVNPGTLDYIFEKKSANTEDVSVTAIPACRVDAEEECLSNEMLFDLARENAINTVKALMKPFLEQHVEYSLEIVDEEGNVYE